nr:hypothetical protein [uncultured Dethiosulfovibrio sp.]
MGRMIVYELMSKGNIVRLPDRAAIGDIPVKKPIVVLLMPYNRTLVGVAHNGAYEKWLCGKNGDPDSWNEVFLYDGIPFRLDIDGFPVVVSSQISSELRSQLIGHLPPPGNHKDTISVLEGFYGDKPLLPYDTSYNDEEAFLSRLDELGNLRLVYWGVRKALVLGDYSMLGRVKTWTRRCMDSFYDDSTLPKMWVSVGDLPGNKGVEELEALLFKPEQLKRMNLEKSGSVVFRGDSGYLVRFEGQRPFGEVPVSVWMYFPFFLWEDMKERKGLRPQEIVILSWGYLDSLEASKEMERYRLPLSIKEPIDII